MSTRRRSAGFLMFWSADDPGPEWCAGVAGDRPYRYAKGLSVAGVAGAGGAQARSAERSSVLLPWSPRRSFEGDLARRPGGMPVRQAAGTGPFPVALDCRWSGDDLGGPARLSAVRHRLAQPAGDMAPDLGRVMVLPLISLANVILSPCEDCP